MDKIEGAKIVPGTDGYSLSVAYRIEADPRRRYTSYFHGSDPIAVDRLVKYLQRRAAGETETV